MRRLFNHLSAYKSEKGAVTVIVAVTLTALLAVAALTIDVGLLYQERRQLQTAVDAAALAGAQDLGENKGYTQTQATAQQYVIENSQVSPDSIEVTFPSASTIHVEAETTRELLFARVGGMQASNVKATATASYGAATAVANLAPFLVPLQFVSTHVGEGNSGVFEFGENRPMDPFSKTAILDGSEIIYTLTFINTESDATSVTITDPVPDGSVYVQGSADNNGVYDATTKTVTWHITSVAAGDSIAVSFTVRAIDPPSSIKNTAQAENGKGKKFNATTSGAAQKGFFWLTDFNSGSGGTPDYVDWILNGYPEEVGPGSLANGEGMKASLKYALEERMAIDPTVVIPVYDYTERGGSPGTYHVVGFAEFVITGFDLNGSPKSMTGYFTTGTVVAGAGGGPPPGADFGIRAIWLVD